jgi:hypothetical protein
MEGAEVKAKALGSFSGGLDGLLASRLLMDQGIEVHLATFESPFFSSRQGREGAAMLGVPWRELDFTDEIMEILKEPPSGFGSNMNPCVDCHAAMFRNLWRLARAESFDFIFSGEVLGQRPMSQNRGSLNRVKNLSNTEDRLLRPLSALLMEPTAVEEQGLVNRSMLLGLSGRSRKPQIALAKEMGISRIPAPAGGCLLTDPGYSMRLRVLFDRGIHSPLAARAVRAGRMFDLGTGVGLVGRSDIDNRKLQEHRAGVFMTLPGIPGPLGLLLGPPNDESLRSLAKLMALYAKVDSAVTAATEDGLCFTVSPASPEEAERLIIRLP